MPSIIFTNFDGEPLEIDLSKTSNTEALQKGFQHLDKAITNKKPTTNKKNGSFKNW